MNEVSNLHYSLFNHNFQLDVFYTILGKTLNQNKSAHVNELTFSMSAGWQSLAQEFLVTSRVYMGPTFIFILW